MFNGGWYTWHGSWWAVHWCWDWWFSLGIHVDLKKRVTAKEGMRYGPYADLHLGPAVFSVGVNPVWSCDRDIEAGARVGRRAEWP